MKRVSRACLTFAFAASAITVGVGYSHSGHSWSVRQVPYYINPANSDVGAAAAIAAIQQAANAWSTQSNAAFSFYYMGQTSGSSITNNGKNEVFFRNEASGNIAQTFRYWNSAGTLVDSDIVFYDASWKFFTGSSGCSSGYYIEEIATHEFGHALGLNHSDASTATMVAGANTCATWKRSLDPDDIAAIEDLYPSTGTVTNTAPVVTISTPAAQISVAQGTPVGLAGSATDQEDGNLSGSVTWISSRDGQLGTGASIQRVLSVGNHTITAKIADSQGASAQAQRNITVEAAPVAPAVEPTPDPAQLTLTASGYKVKGVQRVELRWTGATTSSVDFFRNSVKITTFNDGSYVDDLKQKGAGTYTYRLCEVGTSKCSASVVVNF